MLSLSSSSLNLLLLNWPLSLTNIFLILEGGNGISTSPSLASFLSSKLILLSFLSSGGSSGITGFTKESNGLLSSFSESSSLSSLLVVLLSSLFSVLSSLLLLLLLLLSLIFTFLVASGFSSSSSSSSYSSSSPLLIPLIFSTISWNFFFPASTATIFCYNIY